MFLIRLPFPIVDVSSIGRESPFSVKHPDLIVAHVFIPIVEVFCPVPVLPVHFPLTRIIPPCAIILIYTITMHHIIFPIPFIYVPITLNHPPFSVSFIIFPPPFILLPILPHPRPFPLFLHRVPLPHINGPILQLDRPPLISHHDTLGLVRAFRVVISIFWDIIIVEGESTAECVSGEGVGVVAAEVVVLALVSLELLVYLRFSDGY